MASAPPDSQLLAGILDLDASDPPPVASGGARSRANDPLVKPYARPSGRFQPGTVARSPCACLTAREGTTATPPACTAPPRRLIPLQSHFMGPGPEYGIRAHPAPPTEEAPCAPCEGWFTAVVIGASAGCGSSDEPTTENLSGLWSATALVFTPLANAVERGGVIAQGATFELNLNDRAVPSRPRSPFPASRLSRLGGPGATPVTP
jgi:hypothetical protein